MDLTFTETKEPGLLHHPFLNPDFAPPKLPTPSPGRRCNSFKRLGNLASKCFLPLPGALWLLEVPRDSFQLLIRVLDVLFEHFQCYLC